MTGKRKTENRLLLYAWPLDRLSAASANPIVKLPASPMKIDARG